MTLVIRNRCISDVDLQTIRGLIEVEGLRGRTHLSRRLCRLWDWRQANLAFREIACRELLRRLDKFQLIELPVAQHATRRPGYQNRIRRGALAQAQRTIAEQAIRFVVIDRHITQGTRSPKGRRFCERIWLVVATCRLQKRSILRFLHQAILAWAHQITPPSRLPVDSS